MFNKIKLNSIMEMGVQPLFHLFTCKNLPSKIILLSTGGWSNKSKLADLGSGHYLPEADRQRVKTSQLSFLESLDYGF